VDKQQPASLKTILLVDDRDDTRLMTKWFLSSFGYVVESVKSADHALQVFNPKIHDLVITDNSMPGMTGLEMAAVLKIRSSSTPILMYSGSDQEPTPSIDLVVKRPTHLLVLKDAVHQLLSHSPPPPAPRA
jgi:CheY-like chemotaxis protein